jgi:hypothetical protein
MATLGDPCTGGPRACTRGRDTLLRIAIEAIFEGAPERWTGGC